MRRFSPSRRLLGVPAWIWVILPIPLLAMANSLWKVWPPSKLAEPPQRSEIFREPILVARDGRSLKSIPFRESKGVKPLWDVNVIVNEKSTLSWDKGRWIPTLFRRTSHWSYELTAHRFDSDWKGESANSFAMSATEVNDLKPQVIAELNQRQPSEGLGDRLDDLLTNGINEASYICPQNAIIVGSWLALPMALIGLLSMFVAPQATGARLRRIAEPSHALQPSPTPVSDGESSPPTR